ncbi:Uncharacterised protein [Bacteroides heparinolyticus]|uniref:Uncharacterized protein n=1 Tax=Prevotella heparinolytica TaxID=28113 RepID=A0A449I4I5_9BACE|nr:Uncharacterised protein [Bacteroides heparinolyticus]
MRYAKCDAKPKNRHEKGFVSHFVFLRFPPSDFLFIKK